MSIAEFFSAAITYPWVWAALFLNFGVIFVNGWTDGPNSIATCVTTRAMTARAAIIMCAILNFLGVLVFGFIFVWIFHNTSVAGTISKLVDVSAFSHNTDLFLCLVSCGLLAILIMSLICTKFGIPSSQSNLLIGGITGAGMAATCLTSGFGSNWFAHIGLDPWVLVLIGFFGSLVVGFFLGFGISKLLILICRRFTRGRTTRFFVKGQIFASGLMSFVHGMQDGGKFIGVFAAVAAVVSPNGLAPSSLVGEWWIFISTAVVIAGGTMMGGYGIIKTMGQKMGKLQKYQAFATDLAAGLAMLVATFTALPVSSSNVKATAILGAGASRSFRRVKWGNAAKMILSWVLLFPAGALIGFLALLAFGWTCC